MGQSMAMFFEETAREKKNTEFWPTLTDCFFLSREQDMCHYVDVTCLTFAQNMTININQPSLVLAI